MQIPTVITDTATLAEFCARLQGERFITIDTEFIRERTYFSQLCLVQVGTSTEAVAIDPLAEGMDLGPLLAVMRDEKILKVFHAAGQDLEIFYQLMGELPKPMYDTQIAAMVLGFGEQVGYEKLVNDLVGATLDKASRFTDWAKRPLSHRQLVYALDDVIHLRTIYEIITARITEKNRESWIAQEMAEYAEAARYAPDPERAWRKLKVKSRAPEYLHMLRAVAAWRERVAMEKNIPRGRFIRDDTLLQIAALAPDSLEELQEVRGLKSMISKRRMDQLLEVMQAARLAPREEFPKAPERVKPLKASMEACLDVMRMLLKQRAEEHDVVMRLVASKDELEEVVRGQVELADAHFMQGWRYEVFGRDLEGLLSGKLHAVARTRTTGKGYALDWRAS